MRFPPVDLGTGPWSKRTVASQTENSGPMTGAQRPRGSKGKVSLDNADAVIDGATFDSMTERILMRTGFLREGGARWRRIIAAGAIFGICIFAAAAGLSARDDDPYARSRDYD